LASDRSGAGGAHPTATRTRGLERFFVVSGGDGAGKTTMLERLAALRPEWEVGSYRPADWLPHERLPHFDWQLERHPKTVVHRLEPLSRAGFFLSMISAHWEYWILSRLEAGKVVVVDSYYYRFYAKERVRGSAPEPFYAVLELLPSAAALILAELAPERAAERKRSFDRYEVGSSADREDFLAFQRRVLEELRAVARRTGTPLVRLDADRPADEVAEDLAAIVEGRLARSDGKTRSEPC
jgi:thymidylate kinase